MATKAFQKFTLKSQPLPRQLVQLKADGIGNDELATIDGKLAQVVKIMGNDITLQVFEGTEGIPTNAEVIFLGKTPSLKVSDQLAGRFPCIRQSDRQRLRSRRRRSRNWRSA